MNKTHRSLNALAVLAFLPLGLAADQAWPTPPPVAWRPSAAAPANGPAVIYNGPVVNMAPAAAPAAELPDFDPTLQSRRRKSSAPDPHERGLFLGGPRVGVTYLSGAGFDKLKKSVQDQNPGTPVDPTLVQFGWQFEYHLFRTDQGVTALTELIPLVGGLNQGLALPSGAWLVGLRNDQGLELGVGPDVGMDGGSFLVAIGGSADLGGLHVPLNAAVGMGSAHSSSFSLSTGFNL